MSTTSHNKMVNAIRDVVEWRNEQMKKHQTPLMEWVFETPAGLVVTVGTSKFQAKKDLRRCGLPGPYVFVVARIPDADTSKTVPRKLSKADLCGR